MVLSDISDRFSSRRPPRAVSSWRYMHRCGALPAARLADEALASVRNLRVSISVQTRAHWLLPRAWRGRTCCAPPVVSGAFCCRERVNKLIAGDSSLRTICGQSRAYRQAPFRRLPSHSRRVMDTFEWSKTGPRVVGRGHRSKLNTINLLVPSGESLLLEKSVSLMAAITARCEVAAVLRTLGWKVASFRLGETGLFDFGAIETTANRRQNGGSIRALNQQLTWVPLEDDRCSHFLNGMEQPGAPFLSSDLSCVGP